MLTAARARDLLDYRSETGELHWRLPGRGRKLGRPAGVVAKRDGYRRIRVDQQLFLAHRVIWLWVHGEWPVACLDHVNMQRDDNRLANLREATVTQNMGNRRRYKNNVSGRKGVWWHEQCQRWAASIRVKGRNRHLGLFVCPDAAAQAYRRAAADVFGEFARCG